jgi:hypothetical protein
LELAGRRAEIGSFDLLVAKTRHGRHERSMVLHGLRGVGKTVLLNEFRRQAERAEFLVVSLEGRDAAGGPAAVRAKLGRSLLQAGRRVNRPGIGKALRQALGSIASFSAQLGVTGIDIGVELARGRADSGSIEVDLEEMVEDLCTALGEKHSALVFLIDEMQEIDHPLLTALLAVQHQASQREWPFYVVGAGLPNLPAVLSGARTYAERLFSYRHIGALVPDAAAQALVVPQPNTGPPTPPRPATCSWRRPAAIRTSSRNTARPPGTPPRRRPSPPGTPASPSNSAGPNWTRVSSSPAGTRPRRRKRNSCA